MAEPDHLQTVAGARLHSGLVGAALQFLLFGVGQPYSVHRGLPPPVPFGKLTPPTCLEDLDAAWSYGVEARQCMEERGDRVGLVRSLDALGNVALARGDRGGARTLLEERLALCRELGASDLLLHPLGAMGHLERDAGDYARARSFYQESLVLRREVGDRFALAQSLEDFAVLAGHEQQAERAIRRLGAGEAFCETLGARPPVAHAAEYERAVVEGRAALGEAAFAAAWAEGRAMSIEQAVECALGDG